MADNLKLGMDKLGNKAEETATKAGNKIKEAGDSLKDQGK
jgi:hypothetical protein